MARHLPQQYAKILYYLTKDTEGDELDELIRSFVNFLSAQQVLSRADNIINSFIKYSKKQEGISQVCVETASEISKETKQKVIDALGGKVEAEYTIDKKLLGGIMIKSDDLILDGTIKTQIEKMKERLMDSK